MAKKIRWIDHVKVMACVLVVFGHFFQSMTQANILLVNGLYTWFETTIYYFHVPLFLICSGFLYQKYSTVNSFTSWKTNICKKAVVLGVPYFAFSLATWVLKSLFSGLVNDQTCGLFEVLFLHPASPYWYLYCLFCVFFLTPTFVSKKMALVALGLAFIGKLLVLSGEAGVYAVSTVLMNEIWFVFGMCMCIFEIQFTGKRTILVGGSIGMAFLMASIVVNINETENGWISFVLGMLACIASVVLIAGNEQHLNKSKILSYFAKYTMSIFLMHTLFTAPIRVVLLRFGITSAALHIIVGLAISFIGPIVAAEIMKKLKYLEFFLYPGKFVNIK